MREIIESIVEQHAAEAALLWPLRDAATSSPGYDLRRLERLDERVEAHLDGLRIAGDAGWEIGLSAVDDEPGQVFAATVLAVERGDLRGIARILDLGGEEPALARGLVAGLGWADPRAVAAILRGLLAPACPPALWYLGIAACAAHRRDPGDVLARALSSSDERLQLRALKAAGELGRADLLPDLLRHLGSESAEVRFRSAWSAALLGDRHAARALGELTASHPRRAEAAIVLAVRRADFTSARTWIHALAAHPGTRRAAIAGAGALGDPALVPWLLSAMQVPELARLAGEAFTFVTGIEIEGPLAGEAPPDFQAGPADDPDDEDVAMDPDDPLRWPNPAAAQARWQERRAAFASPGRRLLGQPIAQAHLREVLRAGSQRLRAAAAIELAVLAPGAPLFEVRAPAFRQKRALGS